MSVRRSPAHPIPDDLPTVRAQYGIAQRSPHGGGRFRHNVDGTIEDEAEPIKVFIGIESPAHWQAVLAEVQTRLCDRGLFERVRWLDPDCFHVSLRALGYVRRARTEDVDAAVTDALARAEPFELRVDRLGMFQNPGEFILWVGVQDETAALGPLKATIESALGTIGYKAQRGKLTPHITLGRIWGELDGPLASQVRHLLNLTPIPAVEPHDVRRVSMIHSGREAGELRYTRLATAPIGPYD